MIDKFFYSENRWSIKTENHCINISEILWNDIFESILNQTSFVYFTGFRLDYKPESFLIDLGFVSKREYVSIDNFMRLFFEVSDIQILSPRKLLSCFFDNYEYPALIFSQKDIFIELSNCVRNRTSNLDIPEIFEGVYLIHKQIEQDVLWFNKSSNMPTLN
ncbi:hypothetical protein [Edaphocola aurantiacus]|uniref:hypothetical protein n=1 Tax=Edaphocola aurantiacus TaxID=2601682 RepID=UPI001C978E65|nr:hypothetical protein [Edaphocola aurantiacus]